MKKKFNISDFGYQCGKTKPVIRVQVGVDEVTILVPTRETSS